MKTPTRADVVKAAPAGTRSLLESVLREARGLGAAVYLVGGPVRDVLLDRPLRDVDLIVEPRPGATTADLVRRAAPAGGRVVAHDRFGTVHLESDGASIDVATVRSESYAHAGALPEVREGTLEDDLRRRDFTVNALAFPLTRAARRSLPPIVDPGGGLADLEAGLLRVFHPRSFHDDPTRALRAARLAPRLGFSLARGSRAGLRDALRDGAFGRVSGERFRRELEKVFEDVGQGLDPARSLGLLDTWHVLAALEPGLHLPRGAATPLRRLGRLLREPRWAPGPLRSWVPGFSLWLAELDRGLRARTLRRFRVRGSVAARINDFPRNRDRWLRQLTRARGRGAIDKALQGLDEEDLHGLAASSGAAARRRIVRFATEDRGRRLPLRGSDLLELGLRGPAVGRALARIRTAYLDGVIRSREDALALAREMASRRGRGTPPSGPET